MIVAIIITLNTFLLSYSNSQLYSMRITPVQEVLLLTARLNYIHVD
ncbi:hypothetical protein EDC52_106141 [Biostraticola tofi]|uniref:Uncharacterized protein n=1 Tax=Biostraticola tofi TaxID=466109 RepID=A0A4R3YRX3_9GAMM|nr:hypothetical protein EDC52_106141 [Biostraticola tofi]